MIKKTAIPKRKFLIPEVIQTSDMDCGPATLKALLGGYNIAVNYGRLREACQTDVDGTSIDTLEEIAITLGLDAEQIIVPTDYLFLKETQAFPSIIVVRNPNGMTHFVVLWRQYGKFLQIMDPATGRRWIHQDRFLEDLYTHTASIPIETWEEYVISQSFQASLLERLALLEIDQAVSEEYIKKANTKKIWLGFASLDASIRMVSALIKAKGVLLGEEAQEILSQIFNLVLEKDRISYEIIPSTYWSVQTISEKPQEILLSGSVLVQINGLLPQRKPFSTSKEEDKKRISPELTVALQANDSKPSQMILHFIKKDGLLTPLVVLLGLVFASIGVVCEGFFFKELLNLSKYFNLISQRSTIVVSLFLFFIFILVLELSLFSSISRIGRRFETRFRLAFLKKIPQLGDRYFHSRLTSDMAHRAHELRELRKLPTLASKFFQQVFQIIFTTIGILWLSPANKSLVITAVVIVTALPLILQPLLWEQDLKYRTHEGALGRFYLDALLGLIPIRTHSAAKAIRREYETLLVKWGKSALNLFKIDSLLISIIALVNVCFTVWLLFNFIEVKQNIGSLLLLLFWVLKLPVLGQALAETTNRYPLSRNIVLRLLEPLNTPEESELWYHIETEGIVNTNNSSNQPRRDTYPNSQAVKIQIENVDIVAGGNHILSDISMNIEPGEHIAVVGSSGAGKSSLVGLLLGWHRPAKGRVLVDDELLHGDKLAELRQQIAWVDPAIQIWNRTILDNVKYGSPASTSSLETIIKQADLVDILKTLPDGESTLLGESGGLVSGGEGQRVRFARAMFRNNVKLVILDEPFRGLDRKTREKLLIRARNYWKEATLVFISHDVSETLKFNRVLVIDTGRVVEDDVPQKLIQEKDSFYYKLNRSDELVRSGLWKHKQWRTLTIEKGRLKEK
ncbi:MAG: ATP-binding cassette domain-containing protein [Spirochaetota bacterium]